MSALSRVTRGFTLIKVSRSTSRPSLIPQKISPPRTIFSGDMARRATYEPDEIVNNVCYFRLALQRPDGTIAPVALNLPRIYREYRNVWPLKYDPQQFGSANARIEVRQLGLKKVAVLVFSTGKIVCPGPSSALSGLITAHAITFEMSRHLGAPFLMREYNLPNLVGKIHTHKVDIVKMAEILGKGMAKYIRKGEEKAFPACFVFPHRYAIGGDRVVYLVFRSGKVVITGCRSEDDVKANWGEARRLCAQFPLLGPIEEEEVPSAIEEADRELRKLTDPETIFALELILGCDPFAELEPARKRKRALTAK